MKKAGPRRGSRTAWYLLSPLLAGTAVFFGLPFLMLLKRSFFKGTGAGRFVGLQNYQQALESRAFRLAAGNTLLFLLAAVPLAE